MKLLLAAVLGLTVVLAPQVAQADDPGPTLSAQHLGNGSVTATAVPTASTVIRGTTYNFAGAAPTSAVSVGAPGAERQIQNVAAGQISGTSTDAINGSQLFAVQQSLESAVTGSAAHYVSINDGGVTRPNYNNDGATADNAIRIREQSLEADGTGFCRNKPTGGFHAPRLRIGRAVCQHQRGGWQLF